MKETYFTFGQKHVHSVNGKTFDKDCVALIRSINEDPRDIAVRIFGLEWCWQHDKVPDMSYYPRGIIDAN